MKNNLLSSLALSLFHLASISCGVKTAEVLISSPLQPKFVAKGYTKIYIADFFVTGVNDVDKNVNINVNKEIKETLKSEFKDRSGYEVEDLKIEFDMSKTPDAILKDPEFWASLDIKDKQKSMILTGAAEFSNHEKSGLVSERIRNPQTGFERNVTQSRERLQLVLAINLYLLDATTGNKLFSENFKEEEVYEDVSNVSLPLFYDVFERIAPKIVGVLVPYRVAGSRTLLQP
jgi:hypothetical protein